MDIEMPKERPIAPASEDSTSRKNQLLHQYTQLMQSEVGRTGRKLQDVAAEYRALKTQHPKLAEELKDVELPSVTELTPEKATEQRELMVRLEEFHGRAFANVPEADPHPWHAFAQPDFPKEEAEALVRTVRFAQIQLNKFWVEIQSFPLFLNALNEASIEEIEKLFQWLESSPDWNEIVKEPRLIPLLSHAPTRQKLLEFRRDVKSVRALKEALVAHQKAPRLFSLGDYQAAVARMNEGVSLVRRYALEDSRSADLDSRIGEIHARLGKVQKVQKFFGALASQSDAPEALRPSEAQLVFQASDCIRRMPKSVIPWRKKHIREPAQRLRIEAWKNRARPILEMRKRLEGHFRLDMEAKPEKLRDLAVELTTGSVFRKLNAGYREILRQYKTLLQPGDAERRGLKETPLQMSERLNEWAGFIEQSRAFAANTECQIAFAPMFDGIDTDFSAAYDANLWAGAIRAELMPEGIDPTPFAERWVEYIFEAPETDLNGAAAFGASEEAREIENLLKEPEFAGDREFAEIACEEETRLQDLVRLRETTTASGLIAECPLGMLGEVTSMTEEILFLMTRMESDPDLKSWLKSAYRGSSTDLQPIEQAMAYVKFIESACLPEALKSSFLSAHGPQRLVENRGLVAPALASLAAVKDHMQRLETATYGRSRPVSQGPVLALLEKFQHALKHANHLGEWLEYVRYENTLLATELKPLIELIEQKRLPASQACVALELAVGMSLFKHALGSSFEEIEGPSASGETIPGLNTATDPGLESTAQR